MRFVLKISINNEGATFANAEREEDRFGCGCRHRLIVTVDESSESVAN